MPARKMRAVPGLPQQPCNLRSLTSAVKIYNVQKGDCRDENRDNFAAD
jgi:hypothetical protein